VRCSRGVFSPALSKLLRNVLWFDSLELSSKDLTVQITATGLFVFHLALQG